MTPAQIFAQKGLWLWWLQNNGNGTNIYDGVSEKGIDYSNTFGTKIGAIASGKVIQVIHNANAINDIVIVKGSNSGYWLYQHITSLVQVGQNINVGTVVGTQNGLPIDQYSSGSHIEVRYAANWIAGVDQWYQQWINPVNIFKTTANTDIGTQMTFSTLGTIPEIYQSNPDDPTQAALNALVNSFVSPFETGITSLIGITGMLVIAGLLLYFGVVLLTGKDIINASTYAKKQVSNHKAVLEKLAVLI